MLRLAICDDMPTFIDEIKTLFAQWEHCPNDLQIDRFNDADSLLQAHCSDPYDLILLDIVMPLLNGIEAARELRRIDPTVPIVFLTASPEFAVDAFAVRANHYLLKPIDPSKLYLCLDELLHNIHNHEDFLMIHDNHVVHRIRTQEIESIEAHLKHMQITLTDGSTLWSTDPLYYFAEKLSSQKNFIKCHRSYMVNLHYVRTYTKKDLTMLSGRQIPISRNLHKEVETAYLSLLFDKN